MIKLTYSPAGADGTPATKQDMSGAVVVLGSMLTLRDLGCTTAVTGYLMCTNSARKAIVGERVDDPAAG